MKNPILPSVALGIVFLSTLLLTACGPKEPADMKNNPAKRIANAYGIENFDKISHIAFTFNVGKDSSLYSRSWSWAPKTDQVTYTGPDDTLTYSRKSITSDAEIAADQKFINDTYWLLFPYQLLWSEHGLLIDSNATAPLSNLPAVKLTISYKDAGGYTPGDAYDIFVDENNMITEWIFRRDGVDTPSMITTWEGVKEFGGLKIATDHYNADSTFRLFFTGIEVE